MKKEKLDIITFKVPESLRDAMKGIPNRSEFIRNALVAALDSICPLCKGTGVMMPNQRPHWESSSTSIILKNVEPVTLFTWCANAAHMNPYMFRKPIETAQLSGTQLIYGGQYSMRKGIRYSNLISCRRLLDWLPCQCPGQACS